MIMTRKLFFPIILSAAAITAAAQEPPVTFGVRLGMDITLPGGTSDTYNTGAGFSLGGVAKISLPKHFHFEPGLYFSYTAMSADNPFVSDDGYLYQGAAKYWGLKIPLMVGYDFDVAPKWVMSVATGPYINLNLYARQQLSPNLADPYPLPESKVSLFGKVGNRFYAGWAIKLSVTFAKSYYVGLTTGVAFTPLASYGNRDNKIKIYRHTIAISLGYNF